jgi:hypothetical protein
MKDDQLFSYYTWKMSGMTCRLKHPRFTLRSRVDHQSPEPTDTPDFVSLRLPGSRTQLTTKYICSFSEREHTLPHGSCP